MVIGVPSFDFLARLSNQEYASGGDGDRNKCIVVVVVVRNSVAVSVVCHGTLQARTAERLNQVRT